MSLAADPASLAALGELLSSVSADRQALSAYTSEAVLPSSSTSSRGRLSCTEASVTV